MSLFIISQTLVGLSAILDVISFQIKNRTIILSLLCISSLLISAHFAILNQWTAAFMLLIGACRFLTGIFTYNIKTEYTFYFLTFITTVLSFENSLSIIACIASLLHTRASFSNHDKTMRVLMILGTGAWLFHDIFIGSPVAVLVDVLFIFSGLLGYYRIYKKTINKKSYS
ncbi:YgjV family protein [Vibrio campbellii]|uniref:YgjV family protein n=1 Tax=Vibrio campbellii TaxID=680 RepID=UPI00168CFC37|nr:YgjV family protein [Vibrio campbellii]